MNTLEKEILEKIKPREQEQKRFEKTLSEFLEKIKELNYEVGGSAARGTWLKNTFDIDIFVKFDSKKNKTEEISLKLEKKLKKIFGKLTKVHGSRDYFQINFKNYVFELIPVLDVKKPKEAKNSTDLSPLHVKWFNKRADDKLRDQVRIAKMFCKANECYGAESYINGFSGYVLEILLVYYKSFRKLIRYASSWNYKKIIDVEKKYKGREVFKKLNKSKLKSPLIVIDPVYPERNAAAALSYETFVKFKKICSEYLKKPDKKFFEIKELDLKSEVRGIKKTDYVILEVQPYLGNPDIEGTKILKVYEKILKHIEIHGFKIKKSGWNWKEGQKGYLWYVVKKGVLDKKEKHYGPPSKDLRRVLSFRKKWKNHKIQKDKNGKMYVMIDRELRTLQDFVLDIIKKDFVKERVKDIKIKSKVL